MTTIDGHTFDEGLLSGGWVIDAGCRFWRMTDFMQIAGEKVYALDIEEFYDIPDNVIFKRAALLAERSEVEAHYFGDGTGNFVKGVNEQPYNGPDRPCETKKVLAITLKDIYEEIGTDIDLLKLDIEGSEYKILANLESIPKQITVEFHQHCHEILHNKWIGKVLEHMAKNYEIKLFSDMPRYPYMDCLFIRKDLI